MNTLKIAVIGDQFILSNIFEHALRDELGDRPLEIFSKDLEWPDVPFFGENGPAGNEIREYSGSPDELYGLLASADALVTHLAPVTEDLLNKCENLKFIGVSRGGPTNINIKAAKAKNVVVCNVPGRNAAAVAEFAVGVILANIRRITVGHTGLSQGIWRGDLYRYDLTGDELSDLTVGVLGYSHVGQRLVRLLKPFGCKILICDPYVTLSLQDKLDGVGQVDIDELINRSDVLSLHARSTPETVGILSAERIAKMKQGAVVINTARGSLIDQDALVSALKSGKLGGAALDTYEVEPPNKNDELLTLPNVTLTPHIAGASRRVSSYAAEMIAQDLGRYLRGEKVQHACT